MVREVLGDLTGLWIRADFSTKPEELTFLDDFRIWNPADAPRRLKLHRERLREFELATAWRAQCELATLNEHQGNVPYWQKLDGVLIDGSPWLNEFGGRKGVFVSHPVSRENPTVMRFKPAPPVPDGAALRIVARSSDCQPGVHMIVLHDGKNGWEADVTQRWETFSIPLSATTSPDYEIQIHADGWSYEECFIDSISLVLPDSDAVPSDD